MAEPRDIATVIAASECLHSAVQEFVVAVSRDYIDFSVEQEREDAASRAIESFEKACMEANRAASALSDSNRAIQLREVVSGKKEGTSVDIITYQRAMLRFKKRKAQFKKCNPLTRNLLSPRASKYDPWGEDSASPRSRELGEILCILIPFVILGLFATGYVLASNEVGGKTSSFASRLPNKLPNLRIPFIRSNVTGIAESLTQFIPSFHRVNAKSPVTADIGKVEL